MGLLDGVRVLDLTGLLPGPYCTMLLGDLGAEVIKIERPDIGDYIRDTLPGIYYAANRNKKSVTVNLKSERGRGIVHRLVRDCDVAVEGFRPGVAEDLGVDYETLREFNAALVYCSISGYGQEGPYEDVPGHDLNYLSLAGAMSIPARVNHDPERAGLPVADLSSAMFAALSILASIIGRDRTGEGQYIDVSMADSALSWVSTRIGRFLMDETFECPSTNEWPHVIPTNDVFEAADGKKLAIGVLEEHFWEALCRGMDREDLLRQERFRDHRARMEHREELHGILDEEFRTRPREEWLEVLTAEGVPVSPVNTPREALNEQQFQDRGMIGEVFVPQLDKTIQQIAYPALMNGAPPSIDRHPPAQGEHTDEVLGSLGYTEEQIQDMRRDGVV